MGRGDPRRRLGSRRRLLVCDRALAVVCSQTGVSPTNLPLCGGTRAIFDDASLYTELLELADRI